MMRSRFSVQWAVIGLLLVVQCSQTGCSFMNALNCTPEITTDHFAEGSVGAPYAERLDATCGEWSEAFRVRDGSLPPGLALVNTVDGDKVGIAGTPTQSGTFHFTIELVARPGIAKQYAQKSLSITIRP